MIPVQRWARWLARNTPGRARERISAHYDLGNELFSQFLDPTMMYSCAVFESPEDTLEEASLAKLERVCSKLQLGPSDHVLEIGTGWGGFALYAAQRYGCRVTTTTISAEQHAYATARVREAGLQDRVTVLAADYRDRSQIGRRGAYDKLVSIEMIEAVGWQYFPTFFKRCSELVKDDGAMLLQAIVIEDEAYEVEKAGKSFMNTHVFPGGCLPSMEVIGRCVAKRHRLSPGARRGHHSALRADARALARALPGGHRAPLGARLRRALSPAVGAVPELLRGRLSRAPHPGRAAAAGKARLRARAEPSRRTWAILSACAAICSKTSTKTSARAFARSWRAR